MSNTRIDRLIKILYSVATVEANLVGVEADSAVLTWVHNDTIGEWFSSTDSVTVDELEEALMRRYAAYYCLAD